MDELPRAGTALGRQAGGFALVGALGFAVDAGMFWLLNQKLGLAVLPARALAFIPATIVTWVLNRSAVFGSSRDSHAVLHEYLRYLLVQGLGIAINFACFYFAMQFGAAPLVALVVGSAVAMTFNFVGAKILVFGK